MHIIWIMISEEITIGAGGGALDENGKGWLVNGGLKEQGVQNENFSGSQDLKIQWDCLLESLSYLIFSHY